ncbi:MAG: decaprenylphospho-beta-D-erythro-pentofuranosid-2-ulose 2-reductase [Candidatus Nanopelagicales bacterium]
MINAMGAPQSVLVLGGTSEIAGATVRAFPRGRLRRVVLAGRTSDGLAAAAARLEADGIAGVEWREFDATATATHGAFVDSAFDAGDIDVVLLAFGILGNQADAEADPSLAVDVVTTNFTGAVSVGLHVARRLRAQGHGTLVVVSSAAADRARRASFVYGASKAGLDAFAQGLGDSLVGSGAQVIVVRPGRVRTRMTAGMPEIPMTVDPHDVGTAIVEAVRKGRETVYVPAQLRVLMTGVKAMPRAVFRKMPL